MSNVYIIQHERIAGAHSFNDNKHLNKHGIALFATDLKGAILGTTPRTRNITQKNTNVGIGSKPRIAYRAPPAPMKPEHGQQQNRYPSYAYAARSSPGRPASLTKDNPNMLNDVLVRLISELYQHIAMPR